MKSTFVTLTFWGMSFFSALTGSQATTSPPPDQPTADSTKPRKPTAFDEKIRNSRKLDGLFTMFQDTVSGSLQLYVKKAQLGDEFIYQCFSISGPTSMFLN